jgi:hypothetical protein
MLGSHMIWIHRVCRGVNVLCLPMHTYPNLFLIFSKLMYRNEVGNTKDGKGLKH